MDLPDEFLGALRMLNFLVESLKVFQGLDERTVVLWGGILVTTLLYGLLDDKQGFPASKHVRVSRDVLWVPDTRAGVVDAHPLSVKPLIGCGIAIGVSRQRLPQIGTFQELEPRAGDIHPFQGVDKTEDLGLSCAEVFAHLLDEGEYPRPYHHMVQHIRVCGHPCEVFGERSFSRWNGEPGPDGAIKPGNRLPKEVPVVVPEGIVWKNHGDLLSEVIDHPG